MLSNRREHFENFVAVYLRCNIYCVVLSGVLTLVKILDRESHDLYTLTVQASDGHKVCDNAKCRLR